MALWAALSASLLALAGCGGGAEPQPDTRGIQRMLDRKATAVLDRDADGFLAAVQPGATGYRAQQRRMFDNLADVPLGSWRYKLVGTGGFEPSAGPGRRIAAKVELRYRIAGYDTAPVTALRYLTLTERDGRWYTASDAAAEGASVGGGAESADGGEPGHSGARGWKQASQQLWDQGRIEVVRGRRSLVLGVGQDRATLRDLAADADRAAPAVSRAWGGEWAGRVVVEAPGSLQDMAALLGAPAAGYRGIAAVTTGAVGGAGAAPADRVIVNPEAYRVLGEQGQQVVLTHETTHVATRAATSPATPLWLSEGFADWVGYQGTGRTPRDAAPELTAAVGRGELPSRLPSDADFGFDGDADRLARAYEQGWLACRMIAERWGADRLVDFYRAVGEGKQRDGAMESALRTELDIGPDEFAAAWRGYLRERLG
ncbi:hypothetical protein [Streptomyces sp. H27-D2]|uniref:hypothetical protein n=1 Tax=Streptomyces sp. H27-D2 TaxID=3046304 RepID=UPI002DBD2F5A|nr:hypothetical protein [Streptomyces sp. H27-D2]MEC4019314.1 hypothetical protein [Streptomyces sp. H27-D2]